MIRRKRDRAPVEPAVPTLIAPDGRQLAQLAQSAGWSVSVIPAPGAGQREATNGDHLLVLCRGASGERVTIMYDRSGRTLRRVWQASDRERSREVSIGKIRHLLTT